MEEAVVTTPGRRRRLSVALAAAALLAGIVTALAACGSGAGSLEGVTWKLTSWTTPSIDPARFVITATFKDGQMSGRSAVNQYSGPYTAGDDGSFKGGPFAATQMAGPPDAMTAEDDYFKLLERTRSFKVDGATLVLSDSGGASLLTYKATGD